jgi:hypothetical protein
MANRDQFGNYSKLQVRYEIYVDFPESIFTGFCPFIQKISDIQPIIMKPWGSKNKSQSFKK